MVDSHREEMKAEEYPVNYPTSPATLLQFAATRLALDLCNFKRSQNCPEWPFDWENILPVAVPTRIKKLINIRVLSVDNKLTKLCEHFNNLRTRYKSDAAKNPDNDGSDDDQLYDHSRYFDSVSCGPDGSISLELTAKNLLSSDRLSQLHKFGIACVYCFEDDIRRLWSAIPDIMSMDRGSLTGVYRILVDYWTACMGKNHLIMPQFEEITARMTLQCDYWTAFEYILNKSCSTEQLPFISAVLRKGEFKNAEYILPKLNKTQMKYVSRYHAGDIIAQLVWKEKYIDFVLQIWAYAKKFISDEQFHHILRSLCIQSYKCLCRSSCYESAHIRMILYEIWISASISLKTEIFNSNFVEEILKDLSNFDRKRKAPCYHHDMRFFLQLFQDMPFEMRNALWLQYWLLFVVRYRAKFLNNFLELCMKKEDIPKFGETVMLDDETIGSFLDYLFEQQYYEDVMDYLKICSSNDNLVKELGKQMFQSTNGLMYHTELNKFAEFSKFIDACFTDIDEIICFKKHFYFSRRIKNLLMNRLKHGVANDLVRITKLFLYSELDVLYAKGKLLEYWRLSCLDSGEINFNCCKEFLSWCIADSDDSSSSNDDFPVDKVFEILLIDAVSKLSFLLGPLELSRSEPDLISTRHVDEFTLVDEFLRWYFVTSEAIQNYKLSKVRFRDVPGVRRILHSKNECSINDVLCWFFEGNLDEVRCFKSDFKTDAGCVEKASKLTLE